MGGRSLRDGALRSSVGTGGCRRCNRLDPCDEFRLCRGGEQPVGHLGKQLRIDNAREHRSHTSRRTLPELRGDLPHQERALLLTASPEPLLYSLGTALGEPRLRRPPHVLANPRAKVRPFHIHLLQHQPVTARPAHRPLPHRATHLRC